MVGLIVLIAVGCLVVTTSLLRVPQTSQARAAITRGQSLRQAPAVVGTGGLVGPPPVARGKTAGEKTASAGGRPQVTGSALFGGDTPLLKQQGKLGRKLAIVRIYELLGQDFLTPTIRGILVGGSTVLVSLDTHPGMATYASIAAGHEDRVISRYLQEVNQAAVDYHLGAIYIAFEHEADNVSQHAGLGSPAQFIQAWDHIHGLATAAHLDWNQGGRLHWVWLLEHFAFYSSVASAYWPGSSEVDILGVDGYNAVGCRLGKPGSDFVAAGSQLQTPAELFGPALNFAQVHGGIPVFIAEWASVPYRLPDVQAGFIRQMQAYVTSHPQIGAALYWDGHGQGNACNYRIDGIGASLAALAAMGHSAGLQASVVGV